MGAVITSKGDNAAARGLRVVASVVLVVVGTLMCLIALGTPRESGDVTRPGLLIPWYILPVIGTAAAVRLWPGGARRAGAPLLVAIICLSGWCAVFLFW